MKEGEDLPAEFDMGHYDAEDGGACVVAVGVYVYMRVWVRACTGLALSLSCALSLALSLEDDEAMIPLPSVFHIHGRLED